MMWIGAALARVHSIMTGAGSTEDTISEERFAIFLSHRGRDAKQQLAAQVRELPSEHGVFLDCLTLPHGVVNRFFIYGALARTDTVVLVDTPNFDESSWCRKEFWFSDALVRHGIARLERLPIADSLEAVRSRGPLSRRTSGDLRLHYPILPRILRDIDYFGRAPNLFSLKESGYSGDELDSIQQALEGAERPDDHEWVNSIGRTVRVTLANVFRKSPDGKLFDLWTTALQLAVGAFASTSAARSKMAVRAGIDQLSALVKSFLGAELQFDPYFLSNPEGHLALLAGVAAADLAGYNLDERLRPAVVAALNGSAGFAGGLLLLDTRETGDVRDFRIQLAAMIVRNNFGSIGIVQNAADPVHNMKSGDLPLDVLPCITLYPGMPDPFSAV
jgi:hypothetical protein